MQQKYRDSGQQIYDPYDPHFETFVPEHSTHLHSADNKVSAGGVTSSPACLYEMGRVEGPSE